MNEKSLKVLEEYDLELISARRGRGSYICETSLGTKLLADYNGSEKKAAFTSQLLQYMEDDNNVMVCISKLRAKLSDDGNKYIKTIRGLGYRLEK